MPFLRGDRSREKVWAKGKATGRSKYFKTFQTEKYLQQFAQQHSQKRPQYAMLDGLEEQGALLNVVYAP
jgi:hypothetical protein